MSNGITVEGVKLNEYLKDKEQISDGIKREKLRRDGQDRIVLLNHIKPKYRQYKEKNGSVKILNQREKNIAMYEQQTKKFLDVGNYRDALLTVLLSHPKQKIFTVNLMTETLSEMAGRYKIKIKKNISYSARAIFNTITKSKLSEYMHITKREWVPGEGWTVATYRIKDEYLNLTFTEIEKLSKKNIVKRNTTKKSEPVIADKKPAVPDEITNIDNVIDKVKNLQKDGTPLFVVQGDFNINFHF